MVLLDQVLGNLLRVGELFAQLGLSRCGCLVGGREEGTGFNNMSS
jgi:hypothetical protein